MTEDLDLQALLRFAMVVEAGGFSAAARELGVPRQSVHRSVSQLEERYGVTLLETTTRSVRPTVAGYGVYDHARAMLQRAREAASALRAAGEEPAGLLRLAAPALYAEAFLGPALQLLLERWPHVRVEASFTVDDAYPVRDGLDLALRLDHGPEANERGLRLGTYQLRCVAAPAYLEASPVETPMALARDAIVYGTEASRRWLLTRDGRSVRVPLSPRLRVDSALSAFEATSAGLGVSVLPDLLVDQAIADGRLEEVLPGWRLPAGPVWAVAPASQEQGALEELFRLLEE